MKALFRILLVLTMFTVVYYIMAPSTKIKEPKNPAHQTEKTLQLANDVDSLARPSEGLSTLIGQSTVEVIAKFGKPAREEPSEFDYTWWTYNDNPEYYMMLAVKKDVVHQVYIAGRDMDVTPFTLGSTLDEIYSTTIIEPEVIINRNDYLYTFALTDDDMKHRILVKFDNMVAQLFIDRSTEKLRAVRFLDNEAMLQLQPYELTHYDISPLRHFAKGIDSEIAKAKAKQLEDLTNLARFYASEEPLKLNVMLRQLAQTHSNDMKATRNLTHESEDYGKLEDRLQSYGVEYEDTGELISDSPLDAIEIIHQWLNDGDSRDSILKENLSRVGTACAGNYCTQITIEPKQRVLAPEDKESPLDEPTMQ